MTMTARIVGVVVGLALSTTACAGSSAPTAARTPAAQATTATTTAIVTATSASTTTQRAAAPARRARAGTAPFSWSTSHVSTASLGKSWHSGCPVDASRLRALAVTFWGFDHAVHVGTLVVNADAVSPIVAAFRAIYAARFPIRQMRPISAYGGDDNRSMAADNTSAFNCRYAVSNGPKSWSAHAYGEAVDLDPLENPYRLDGRILPPAGAPYMNRSDVRPGMVVPGSAPVRAFDAVGWGWGGRWGSTPDYQHFSSTGR
jgi:hypothetical protein